VRSIGSFNPVSTYHRVLTFHFVEFPEVFGYVLTIGGKRILQPGDSVLTEEHIGLKNIAIVGNKIRQESDREFLISSLPSFEFLGFIPYDQAIVDADLANQPVATASQKVVSAVRKIFSKLVPVTQQSRLK